MVNFLKNVKKSFKKKINEMKRFFIYNKTSDYLSFVQNTLIAYKVFMAYVKGF
jgi:hypothetical protein